MDLQIGGAGARAVAIPASVTSWPLRWTEAAMASKALSLSDTGAEAGSAHTWLTRSTPPGNWAAAVAAWDDEQYWHSFSVDT